MNIKVAFTIPNGIDIGKTIAYQSYVDTAKQISSNKLTRIVCQGAGIGRNRNKCVNNAASSLKYQSCFDFDSILFVDYDIEFKYQHVLQLIDRGVDIVSGAYAFRDGSSNVHAGAWGGCIGTTGKHLTCDDTGLHEVDRVGGGFLLIKANVFRKLPHPWFRHNLVCMSIGGQEHCVETSEDFGFCILASEHGYKIHCDMDCRVIHVGLQVDKR